MKIIAEIGSNIWGVADGLDSIHAAKLCGADVVKFQNFENRELYGLDAKDPYGGVEANLHLLAPYAERQGIELMCTAFSVPGYNTVNTFVSRHKIASAEITAIDILETVNSFRKPVLLSTGGASIDQIETAVNILKDCPVTLMYCVTAYPARVVDFRHFEELRDHFGSKYDYGYSDHSCDVLNVPTLARLHGSVILEKHVNFAGFTDTPDAPHSLSGKEFKMMVKHLKGELSTKETFTPCTWQRVKTEHGYFRPMS